MIVVTFERVASRSTTDASLERARAKRRMST